MFDWKKPTVQMLGRWQPWHDGHTELFKRALQKTGQVCIMYRDVGGVDAGVEGQADNPFQFEEVKAKINEGLVQHGFTDGKEYVVVKVPNIIDISYGRGVGYSFTEHDLGKEIHDISATKIRESLKDDNIIIVCDNTFASPYNQQPLNSGADVVIHSSTKYLGGHSDIIGGALIINDNKILADKIKYIQNAVGAVPSPFDCYLLIRSIKTLAVRMERHNNNALEIANYLLKHPKIKNVFYPGLENNPSYEIAKKQMTGFGGILSIELMGDINSAKKFLETIQIFTLAESLGGVESLIEHPAIMTHASIDKRIKDELGISDTLIRLSIGIEDISDLKKSLDDALKNI